MMQNIETKMNKNAVIENKKTAELCKKSGNVLKESIAIGIANTICLR